MSATCDLPTTDLSSTFGVFFWGFVISAVLLGVSLVQGYLYYKNNSDGLYMRSFVSIILALDLTGSMLVTQTMHYYLIRNFGNTPVLKKMTRTFIGEYILTVIIILLSQLFYASRIYAASTLNSGRLAALIIATLSVVAFGAGLAGCYELFMKDRLMSNLALPKVKMIFGVVKLSVALCDALATLSMCYFLSARQTSFKSTRSLLKWLVFFSINRGFLVCAAQIGHMVAYLAWPRNMYWIPFHLAMSKLHTLTLLAMLNSRTTLRSRFAAHANFLDREHPDPLHSSSVKLRNLRKFSASREPGTGSNFMETELPLTPDFMQRNKIRLSQSFTTCDEAPSTGVEVIDIVKSPPVA